MSAAAFPEAPVLAVEGVSKSFGPQRVLDRVSLEVGRNQVVSIVGENGAGKSTLLNILSGILQPDEGRILLHGREVRFGSLLDAAGLGIARVFQEQALIPNIAVYENLLLSHERRFCRFGQLLDRRRMIALAGEILAEGGIELDVRRPTNSYDFSTRQLLEIARACLVPTRLLGVEHPIVLLDEPTSSLQRAEAERFFALLEDLRRQGSVIFVSHRLSEVLAISDAIYVLKDGAMVRRVEPAEASEPMLHGLMVGRERDADYYHEGEQGEPGRETAFAAEGFHREGAFEAVSLELQAGEILGIGGLLGSGKEALARALAGIGPSDGGLVRMGEGPWRRPDTTRLIRQGRGYVPAERPAGGRIPAFSVAANVTLASGGDLFANRFGIWQGGKEQETAERFIRRLGIKAAGPKAPCNTLSGGNQQKVVLARWLCRDLRVLILDNPTRGVDAGAKEEIYAVLRELTARGVAILLVTDELLELIGLSHRIAIMRGGRLTDVLPAPAHDKPGERELVGLMHGPQPGAATLPSSGAESGAWA